MKFIQISLFLLTLGAWSACNNAGADGKSAGNSEATASTDGHAAHGATEHSGEHTYACPMHPEVTGKAGDSCPKCGMDLEHNDNAGTDLPVAMQFRTEPTALEAGKAGRIFLTPRRSDQPDAAVPLDLEHGKKIHMIVVSDDLSYFEHIHPKYDASGAYIIDVLPKGQAYTNGPGDNETYFNSGGNYWVFADYRPSGGNHKLDKFSVKVAGPAPNAKTYTTEKLAAEAGPFMITLQPAGAAAKAGQLVHMKGLITRNGAAVDANSLETYLEAKAHVVIINTETKEYLHVHPEVENGQLDLHTTFDKAGTYRAWIQVKSEGKVHTADYVIKVS